MEKIPEKSVSFSRQGNKKQDDAGTGNPGHDQSEAVDVRSNGDHQRPKECDRKENVPDSAEEAITDPDRSHSQMMEEVDRFVRALSSNEDKSKPPEVPDSVEPFSIMVDSMITKYELKEPSCKFGQNQEEDSSFVNAVNCISKLTNKLCELPSNSSTTACLNRASSALHRAMSFLDDELRCLLDNSKHPTNNASSQHNNNNNHSWEPKTPKPRKQTSFNYNPESDRCVIPESESSTDEEFAAFLPEAVSAMNMIARAMISAGYEEECCLLYCNLRRHAFKEELSKLGFDSVNVEDVQKMQWDSMEGEIASWINIVKHCSTTLFSAERNLCYSVFSDFPSLSQRLFSELAMAVLVRLLNFPGAVVLTKRSTEKVFKFLDLYETLRDLIPTIDGSYSSDSSQELIFEISIAQSRIAEAAISIFCELENSIKSDNGRIPVPSGAVHPLTRYTMNYLKYACEYKDTMEQVFQQHLKMDGSRNSNANRIPESIRRSHDNSDDGTPKWSPFAVQLMTVMDLLDANLDMKSKLYRDPALRYIFLMNNGRYILQKIKGSSEIHEMMGHKWTRKRSTDLRQYHKSYQRETWGKVLQCMSHDGLQVNGKVLKPVLKERFKCFNALFDEIHKTQSTWVVSDEQLQSELRVSISAVVTPAYRSFLGRFKQHLDPGRQMEKYVKYQAEDIEALIDDLFDGNPTSMGRRRT